MKELNEVTVELLQKCNSNCLFCSSLSNQKSEHQIPLEKIYEIIDFCIERKALSINLSGGEPLLYKDLDKVVEYSISNKLKTTIYTSGNITNEIENFISKKKLDKSMLKFIINYPSIEKDVYQKLINSRDFSVEKVNLFIQNLVKEGFQTEVHIVPNGVNIQTLYETVNYLKSIGVRRVSFLKLVMQGRAVVNKELLQVRNDVLAKVLTQIVEDFEDSVFKIRLGIPLSNLSQERCECFAGIAKLIFRYDGTVFPCEAFKEAPNNQKYILGSIYKDTLEEIWNNHPVQACLAELKGIAIEKSEPCPAQLLYN